MYINITTTYIRNYKVFICTTKTRIGVNRWNNWNCCIKGKVLPDQLHATNAFLVQRRACGRCQHVTDRALNRQIMELFLKTLVNLPWTCPKQELCLGKVPNSRKIYSHHLSINVYVFRIGLDTAYCFTRCLSLMLRTKSRFKCRTHLN